VSATDQHALVVDVAPEPTAVPVRVPAQRPQRALSLLVIALVAGVTLWLQPYFDEMHNPNALVRVYLTRALVDEGTTVLLSTHVVDTVQAAADRVIMLAHGRVVADVQTASLGVGELERLFLERLEQSQEAGRR